MQAQLFDQSVLAGMQSILRAVLELENSVKIRNEKRLRNKAIAAALYRELTEAGDQLPEVLRLEQEFSLRADGHRSDEDALEEWKWKQRRQRLDRQVEEYLAAISEWRGELENSTPRGRRKSEWEYPGHQPSRNQLSRLG